MHRNCSDYCLLLMEVLFVRLGEDVSAQDVYELKIMQVNSPRYFYKSLRKDLTLTPIELLRLSAAIRNL